MYSWNNTAERVLLNKAVATGGCSGIILTLFFVRYSTMVLGGGTVMLRKHHESRYSPKLCANQRYLQLR